MFLRARRLPKSFCYKFAIYCAAFFIVLPGALFAGDFPTEQVAATIKKLSPASQNVIAKLTSISTLPAEEWRFHAGDLANGESPDLDDSSWPIVKAGSEAPNSTVWYRRWIEIPKSFNGYDLAGSKIWFRLEETGVDIMTEVVYFNGRRVGMGDFMESVVLLDHATPGEKILVAVKILPTKDKKLFQRVTLHIDANPGRPSPGDIGLEFLSAGLLVPSLSTNASADMATLEKAIQSVDLTALSAGDQAKFDASLKQALANLQPLKPVLQKATVHALGNSHIDAAWLWPWTETVEVVRHTFDTALLLMNEYPDYTYTQSAAAYNDWVADKYPRMNAEIRKRVQEGRWGLVGGMWIEPDLNMPDGESMVRQLLVGKRLIQQLYGVDVRIGWNPDSFGYTWQLPQIYKKSGVDYFVTQKMGWNDTNLLPFKLFWWQSPDGSKVLSYFPHDYGNDDLNPARLFQDLVAARQQAPGMLNLMDLYGVSDHGGGPTRAVLDEGRRWMQPDKITPLMHFGTAQDFFSQVEKKVAAQSPVWNYDVMPKNPQLPAPPAGQMSIPTWNDEMYFEYHRGVATTQANHKRNMRESEEQVLNAEKYASLAWLDGQAYPDKRLNDAWKKVLFNQFHDLAAGTGIAAIYRDAQHDYDAVRWATSEISSQALDRIAAEINTRSAGDIPLLILNPLAWERSGLVTVDVQMPGPVGGGVSVLDALGRVLPSKILSTDKKTNTYQLLIAAKSVPSLGYQVLHAVPGNRPFASDLKVDGFTLENATLKVSVDPKNGCITSLYDKKSHYESIASGGCGNQLMTFKDTPKDWDAWNIDADFEKDSSKLDNADAVEVIDKGPMRAVIRVTKTWQNSKFVQDIALYAGMDQVDVQNDIDWHETHVLLKVAFPLAASSNKATYEIPYGTIERPTTRNNSWEQAKFEVPAMRWADLGDGQHGFSLINESKYGYDAKGNVLRLSLLRSPVWPDLDADRGHHHFGYALYPHAGDWKQSLTVRRGYEYNYKLAARQVSSHFGRLPLQHSYLTVAPQNVVLTAMKKAEDSDGLVLRVYEWAGKSGDVKFTVPPGSTSAILTNLMEKTEGAALSATQNQISAPIHPYEILSVRVDYAPHHQ